MIFVISSKERPADESHYRNKIRKMHWLNVINQNRTLLWIVRIKIILKRKILTVLTKPSSTPTLSQLAQPISLDIPPQ